MTSEEPNKPFRAMRPVERARLADAAELYWVQGKKVEDVAAELGVSRSTVSRMLARARQTGVIQFTVHREENPTDQLRRQVEQRYGVRATVAPVDQPEKAGARMLAVAGQAAAWLDAFVRPGVVLAVAWGSTVENISLQLRPHPVPGMQVVQLHGSGNVATLGTNYASLILDRIGSAFDARVHYFPVPAFFDSASTRAAMWQEKSIQQVLSLRAGADLLLTSVGTPDGDLPGHLYDSGYLTSADMAQMEREHVVGNLGGIFFRTDASTDQISVNDRSTGLPFDELRRIRQRLLVAADPAKAPAISTVLDAGLMTDVVLDAATARAIVNR
ncbi:sugar-binding transcriptional regulator [Propionibacterium australiense]|uniref:Homeobox domain-like n=1 Tax=Propionibacterium australiense TaxID=119981 RepID=A0A383S7C7_9ACTN|nr:sugar-binding domain-containing protein [Propionibacterium australiense]RLP08977.1 transcriptional regulator [Propionibacterium australiense]RLP09090.1 transcriptional regulator [Propionibacterium australiense]SYZ33462.1 Homeobox domain-like [Propionibacterium australiense]VEH91795.1 Deoxyribonucleoside regulator [Propionibacterium australiense]